MSVWSRISATLIAMVVPSFLAAASFTGGGSMFNVDVGASSITLTEIGVNLGDVTNVSTNLYVRLGTYQGYETSTTGWTRVDKAKLSGTALNELTIWNINDLTLLANTTYAFYVNYNKDANILASGSTIAGDVTGNADLAIYDNLATGTGAVGSGVNFGFPGSLSYTTGALGATTTLSPSLPAVPLPPSLYMLLGALALTGFVGWRGRGKKTEPHGTQAMLPC